MIDFTGIKSIKIPEGNVIKITRPNGEVVWVKDTGITPDTPSIPYDPVLENNSWETISAVSKAGLASTAWKVGDKKKITINGSSYSVNVLGFDHDTPSDTTAYGRTKAGITFQLQKIYSNGKMHSKTTGHGGYASCSMRTAGLTGIFNNYLSSDLKSVIVPVNKKSGVERTSSSVNVHTDNLFLLAEIEIYGTTDLSVPGEGSRYEYYALGNSTIKARYEDAYWWTRSAARNNTDGDFCIVDPQGNLATREANIEWGIAFAFCV